MLHGGPDSAQVDGVDAVEVLGRLVGGVIRRDLDAGVVERHVEAAEGGDGALDEGGDLVLVRDVAGDAERLVSGVGQLSGGGAQRLLVGVGEHDGGAGFGEGLRGGEAHPGARAGDDGDLVVEVIGGIHVSSLGPLDRCSCSRPDRKSTRLNSSHANISYAVFCLKKKKNSRLSSACVRPRTAPTTFETITTQ